MYLIYHSPDVAKAGINLRKYNANLFLLPLHYAATAFSCSYIIQGCNHVQRTLKFVPLQISESAVHHYGAKLDQRRIQSPREHRDIFQSITFEGNKINLIWNSKAYILSVYFSSCSTTPIFLECGIDLTSHVFLYICDFALI